MIHPMILELLDPSKRPDLRLLDALPMGVSFAVDGKVSFANDECARMWGYEHGGRMAEIPFFDLIHPEDHAFVMRLWNSRGERADHEPWTYEIRGMRADGSVFPYRCTSIAGHVPGRGYATLAFMLDLSELREAQDRVQVLEQQVAFIERYCGPEDGLAG